MIRVNLLPHVREQRSAPEGGQLWLLLIMGLVVLEIVGLFFFHQTKEDELADVKGHAERLRTEISDIKAIVKDHAKIKARLAELRAREEAIAKLQQGRTGPTSVLLELSRILTPDRGPTIDEATRKEMETNPMATYNPAWDTRRVWLTSMSEAERNVRLEGMARDAGDVYEFAQRLKLSRFFKDVRLLPGQQEKQKESKVELVDFALQVKAIY